eukprot:5231412-Pleurochrysis_carterae.AAC.1
MYRGMCLSARCGGHRVEERVGGARRRDRPVKRVECVDVAPKLGFNPTPQVGSCARGVVGAHAV